MTTFYLDPVNGDDANNGSSWALAWKTISGGATAARIAPGDEIHIAKTPDPVSLGSATWTGWITSNSAYVTLSAAATKTFDNCESGWVAASNVTVAHEAGFEGTNLVKITAGADFGTGKLAYKDLGSSQDFSAYEQISFLIDFNSLAMDFGAGELQIKLCSDTAGDTAVATLSLPSFDAAADNVTGFGISIDNGSALPSNVRSIALYTTVDPGTSVFRLDNIIAHNGFSHMSVIGRNDGYWHGVRSINGTRVDIGGRPATVFGKAAGKNETVTTYYRNGVEVHTMPSTGQTDGTNVVQDSGEDGSPIKFIGGYNTSSSLKDGETWFMFTGNQCWDNIYEAQSGCGIDINGQDYVWIENINMGYGCGYLKNWTAASVGCTFTDIKVADAMWGFFYGGTTAAASDALWYAMTNVTVSGDFYICRNMSADSGPFRMPYNASQLFENWSGEADFHFSGMLGNPYVRLTGRQHRFLGDMYFQSYECSAQYAVMFYNAADCYVDSLTFESTGRSAASPSVVDMLEFELSDGNEIGKVTAGYLRNSTSSSKDITSTKANANRVAWVEASNADAIWEHAADNKSSHYVDRLLSAAKWKGTRPYGVVSDQITAGYTAGWAYAGDRCLVMDPSSTANELQWTFWMPVLASTSYKVQFYVKKSSAASDCSLKYSIAGGMISNVGKTTITLTDSWVQFQSSTITPTENGFIRVDLYAKDGATTGNIGIDSISLVEV